MLSKTISKWILIAFSISWITACESTGDGATVATPEVAIECSTSKCAISGFHDAYVVFSLSGCSTSQIGFEPETTVSGSDQVLCSGGSCTGNVSSFTPSTIKSRTYYVCGWIDIDNDGVRDATDAYSEDQTFISGAPITLSNWSVSYFILNERSQKR